MLTTSTAKPISAYFVPLSAGHLLSALAAVIFSLPSFYPALVGSAGDISPPSGIVEVMRGLVMSMVSTH
ncbi:MAG: hypothetical protein ACLRP3_08585 [Escherichia sp.]